MKKTFLLLSCLLLMLSCTGKIEADLSLSKTEISFTSSASEETVTFSLPIILDNLEEDGIICTDFQLGSDKTLVSYKGAWLTVEKTGDTSILISVSVNPTKETRTGVISVSNGDRFGRIKVNQAGIN